MTTGEIVRSTFYVDLCLKCHQVIDDDSTCSDDCPDIYLKSRPGAIRLTIERVDTCIFEETVDYGLDFNRFFEPSTIHG